MTDFRFLFSHRNRRVVLNRVPYDKRTQLLRTVYGIEFDLSSRFFIINFRHPRKSRIKLINIFIDLIFRPFGEYYLSFSFVKRLYAFSESHSENFPAGVKYRYRVKRSAGKNYYRQEYKRKRV